MNPTILPALFVARTKSIIGDEWAAFAQALQEESPVSIRMNPRKTACSFAFEQPVSWASNAYYLASRPVFTLDPLFHAGCYYVQEASSMFLEQIVKRHVTQPVKVLDLCAAPGGKSTQLAAVLPKGSLLVANEVIRSRVPALVENLIKWGYPDYLVTNNDPAVIGQLTGFFDVVAADVPCSGEGMFRKDTAAVREWSMHTVRLCAERQRRIVADVWPALRPGGLLIYSTCTYNREENEENIDWICRQLGAEPVEEPHRFMPHQIRGEGFFIAALRKNGDLAVIPKIHPATYTLLKRDLKIVSAGIHWNESNKKEIPPTHAWAMSTERAVDAFPVWDLDKDTAVRYLRKEALQSVPAGLPRGYVLVRYSGQTLGFVKNIGSRANNLYPAEWRIRMNYS